MALRAVLYLHPGCPARPADGAERVVQKKRGNAKDGLQLGRVMARWSYCRGDSVNGSSHSNKTDAVKAQGKGLQRTRRARAG
jgi:hypothetical protein